MKIHEFSVKRPVAATMIVIICVVLGLYSMSMLKMEAMPEMDLSMAIVSTTYSGAGSEEVENMVTKKIEDAVSAIEGVKNITAQSSEGSSIMMLEFAAGTDMDDAITDMKSGIDMIKSTLPDDCNDPIVMKLDTSMMPVAMLNFSYEGYDLIQTKKFVEDNVENRLESATGVASLSIMGANDRIIDIKLNPTKMAGYGIDVQTVIGAIAAQNNNLPSGTIKSGSKDVAIRTIGKFSDLRDIENVTVATSQNQIVHIRDIAEVIDTFSDDASYSRVDGENAISMSISAESDANTVEVVNGVFEILDQIKAQNPKFSYNVTMESASYIENSISSVASNAISGCLLAIIVLLLFLGSIKTSLVIGVTMPISVITTFVGMYFSGMTLNVVSLGGLALGVGMLVDNAVVVIENIFRRRNSEGDDAREGAIRGTAEVFSSVIASVITTCIVYVPILFIDNMVAVMFKQLAFSIIFSQCASLVATFLIIPMLSARIENTKLDSKSKLYKILRPFEKGLDKLYVIYEKGLRGALKHRKPFILCVLGAFVVAMVVLFSSGMTLMPETDEGTVTVAMELPQGAQLAKTDEITREAEELIKTHSDVESVVANVGSGSGFSMGAGGNTSNIYITLSDGRKKTTNEVAQEIRELLGDISGATVEVSASSSAMGGMNSNELQWNFSASNEEELGEYVKQLEEELSKVEGVSETSTSIEDTVTETKVVIDSDKAARYGMSGTQIATLVRYASQGTKASEYTEDGLEYDIEVSYPDNYLETYNDLKRFQFRTTTGQWISLSDVASIEQAQGGAVLQRLNQKRNVTLNAKTFGTDMATVNKELERIMKEVPAPEGVSGETGGSLESMMDAMTSLVMAIFLGIVLMYLVMAAQFESLRDPLIIMSTLPLCMIGVVMSIVLFSGGTLSVVGCIGILMLIGIVVNNGILLIEFINQTKEEKPDMSLTDILVYAGKTRMRPVLMTSLTSVLGFVPMAFGGGEGSEMMAPLAQVLLGGLLIGTILTLLVVPVIYMFAENLTNRRKNKKDKKKAKRLNKSPEVVGA